MEPWTYEPRGRFDEHVFTSDALRDNPLGDPHERPLWVYLPPGYDGSDERLPSVYVIQGLTGFVTAWRNVTPFRKNFLQLTDELFAAGDAPPCIVVFVDAWTKLGGSQFVDSPGTGRYHTYLCDEIVPWVDANYRTLDGAAHRGIAGKSSGGYGAMITPLLRPELFGGLAVRAAPVLDLHHVRPGPDRLGLARDCRRRPMPWVQADQRRQSRDHERRSARYFNASG